MGRRQGALQCLDIRVLVCCLSHGQRSGCVSSSKRESRQEITPEVGDGGAEMFRDPRPARPGTKRVVGRRHLARVWVLNDPDCEEFVVGSAAVIVIWSTTPHVHMKSGQPQDTTHVHVAQWRADARTVM